MMKNRLLAYIGIFMLFPIAFIGCGGGGGGDDDGETTTPSIQVSPTDFFDFGTVTLGNTPAPLTVKITNDGTKRLDVSSISLSDSVNFSLDLNGGSNPCATASPALAVGESCVIEVGFQPTQAGEFSATLEIASNDPDTPSFQLDLSGKSEQVESLNVKINQVSTENCPAITAYVSVTDQGNFPVTALKAVDFTITEAGVDKIPNDLSFANDVTEPISVALVMDNSGSMRRADAINEMNAAAVEFVDQLNDLTDPKDKAEIIKFAADVVVEQPFTSDKELLKTAINREWSGSGTAFYDAVDLAITHTYAQASKRKSVIALTDGRDGNSVKGIDELIVNAQSLGVPVFVVGLGENIEIDSLQEIAEETGGVFYDADVSQNLKTIYQQLAEVLFTDQYILSYTSGLGAGVTADLTIGATSGGLNGEDTRPIMCP